MVLIGGGVLALIGLSIPAYSEGLLNDLMDRNRYSIQPSGSQVIRQAIVNTSEAGYIIALPESSIQLDLRIASPTNMTLVENEISFSLANPIVSETFPITETGEYVMTLTNLSAETAKISAVLGDGESIAEIKSSFTSLALTAGSLINAGIIVAIAGVVITVLDRRHISKMKQFGDTSDLV